MVETEIELKSGNNILRGVLIHPADEHERVPLLIIMHALMCSRNMYYYPRLSRELAAVGIASIRMDFNGHGSSDGAFHNMTVSSELQDADVILEYVKGLSFVTDVGITGHSQGGVVAAMTAGRHPDKIKCLVTMAAAGNIEDSCRSGYGRFLGMRSKYIKDGKNLHIYETAAKYHGPACIIQGANDEMVPEKYAREFHRVIEGSELHIIPRCNHEFYGGEEAVRILEQFVADHLLKQ